MTPTKTKHTDGKVEAAQRLFHLVDSTSKGKPICGETSPDALIGSYVEHLDETTPENVRWVREVFDSDGKPVTACSHCVSLYPSVLLDVVPFDLTIRIHFKPNEAFRGYDVTATAFASIGEKRRHVTAAPNLGYFAARWIGGLQFSVDVDANRIVPLVEQANKTKQRDDGGTP